MDRPPCKKKMNRSIPTGSMYGILPTFTTLNPIPFSGPSVSLAGWYYGSLLGYKVSLVTSLLHLQKWNNPFIRQVLGVFTPFITRKCLSLVSVGGERKLENITPSDSDVVGLVNPVPVRWLQSKYSGQQIITVMFMKMLDNHHGYPRKCR